MRAPDPTYTITVLAFKEGKGKPKREFRKTIIGCGSIKTTGEKLFGIPQDLDYDRIAIHIADEQKPVRITGGAASVLSGIIETDASAVDYKGAWAK